MPSTKIFAAPQDVETAFYEALEHADLELMMSVWADDEEIICVHPGGPRLVGYQAIREAWRRIFEHGNRLDVAVSQLSTVVTPFAVLHSVLEQIRVRTKDKVGDVMAPVAASNLYVRGAMGWRMVSHHASPVPPLPADTLTDMPKVLH